MYTFCSIFYKTNTIIQISCLLKKFYKLAELFTFSLVLAKNSGNSIPFIVHSRILIKVLKLQVLKPVSIYELFVK